MALVKGICKNFGECDLADNKEVQEVDKTNFVCEECGKPLHPIDGGIPGGGPIKTGNNKKLIPLIAGAIVIVAGIAFAIWKFGFTSQKEKETDIPQDSVEVKDEGKEIPPTPTLTVIEQISINETDFSLKKDEVKQLSYNAKPEKNDESPKWVSSDSEIASVDANGLVTAKKKGSATICVKASNVSSDPISVTVIEKAKDNEPVQQGPINLGYGIYEGPTKGGKAHGIGGTIRFTRSYSIDLKKASGESVEVNAGDRMINVKMDNNRIIQGQLKRADGSQKWIIIG